MWFCSTAAALPTSWFYCLLAVCRVSVVSWFKDTVDWNLHHPRLTAGLWRVATKVASGQQPRSRLPIGQSRQEVPSTGGAKTLHASGRVFCVDRQVLVVKVPGLSEQD